MWFKTRVGLTAIDEPLEVLAWRSPKTGHWILYADQKGLPEGETRLFFRRVSLTNPTLTLAQYPDRPDVAEAIGQTMHVIARAVSARAPLCDLSAAGDADAWDKEWVQIAWPAAGE
jgi:hypothetical protein